MFKRSSLKFINFSKYSYYLVYLVIIAGGVVRCTGSGMGCPDWPKCFGQWIPPTNISELPNDFVSRYSDGGHLDVEFNVFKTWTEYVNRLLGVLVGFSIILSFYFSTFYLKTRKFIFFLSFLALFLVCLQGIIGAKVVSTNLLPYMISIHMFVALLIVSILIFVHQFAVFTTFFSRLEVYPSVIGICLVCLFVSVVQIFLGAQVRQEIDLLSKNILIDRILWIDNLSFVFVIHRLVAYLVILVNSILVFKLYRLNLTRDSYFLTFCLVLEVLSGFTLTYFDFPNLIQPVHLVLATIVFGIQISIVSKGLIFNLFYKN